MLKEKEAKKENCKNCSDQDTMYKKDEAILNAIWDNINSWFDPNNDVILLIFESKNKAIRYANECTNRTNNDKDKNNS